MDSITLRNSLSTAPSVRLKDPKGRRLNNVILCGSQDFLMVRDDSHARTKHMGKY